MEHEHISDVMRRAKGHKNIHTVIIKFRQV